MKITKSQLIQLIKEETQGEMEFAELEAARQNYKENFRDDEATYQFLSMVEKLVEPLMVDMGLYFEAEAFMNRGELVFTNNRLEVTIDPLGMMGRYDVMVTPQYGAEDDIKPMEISLDTMKGVAQFVNDEVFRSTGMVGEPEAQTELPLEHKVRITKSQLQKVIKEAIREEMGGDGSRNVRVEWDTDGPGEPPAEVISVHADSVRDWNQIKEEEGILRADQALEDMLSNETGWLVMDWDWVE
jgi:hypothetical protein